MNLFAEKHRALLCIIASGLFIQGCGCSDGYACVNGLRITLESVPAAPFQIELLVAGIVQPAPARATCAAAANPQCSADVIFKTRATNQVAIRVTTPNGVRYTQVTHIAYQTSDNCGEDCYQARVTAAIP